ncbi:DUF3105 domain-containing protein [Micromonospora auratinigra]|uniref:DUF3105 domain-containing protein n=1 Tax=Micromonospora auratinigra TaxID=261654 RepID=A0A1A9A494_9ACTN|nr:DUF3105 domain-containing protein [Micromonospora auratinigra]SBT51032.1 Protein of unknown function (DUF3105) [Micromonospora auratinigra]
MTTTTRRQRLAWRAAAVVALAAALWAAATTGPLALLTGTVTGSRAADRPAPCLPGQAVPILDSPHITRAQARTAHYDSDPPTSGPHFAFAAPPGVYEKPVEDGLTVHALEHGHVVVQYGSAVPADEVEALRDIARQFPDRVLLAPRPALGRDVALTAWGRIDRFDRRDEQRVNDFIQRLGGRYDHRWTRSDDCP